MRLVWLLCAVLAWEAIAHLNAGSFLIAGPSQIVAHLVDHAGLISRATWATLSNAAWGFIWGNVTAVFLAAVVALFPVTEKTISAFALLVFCLPLVATGPILRVLFGPGNGPEITLAALAVYYTTFLALIVGLRALPASWSDLVRIYGRGRLTEFFTVRAMASLPYLAIGLQIAAPAALLGAMIGEFTGAERGLGVLILRAIRGLEVEATWALATIAAAISIAVYTAIGWISERLTGYRPVILLAPPGSRRRVHFPRLLLETLGMTLAVLLIWQVSMDALGLNSFFAKRPGNIFDFLIGGDDALANRTILFSALAETLAMTIPGYLAGLALGFTLASLLILYPSFSSAALPIAIALRSIPIIATAPLMVLALGRGAVGTISIVAVMIFFPTLVACLQGLRQTPGQIVDVFESYATGRWRLLLSAQIPAMLPAFFASARMAVPAALLAVTTTEWLATGKGIGVLMALTASTSDYNMLWSSVVVVSLAAVIGYKLVAWLESAVLRIYSSEQVN